ncbi:WD40 repeat domain-containing protein [Spirillospora sp. NPDC047418]
MIGRTAGSPRRAPARRGLRAKLFGGWSQPPRRRRRRVVRLPIVVAHGDAGRLLLLEVRRRRFRRPERPGLKGPTATRDDQGMRESFAEAFAWAKSHPRFHSRSVTHWDLLPYDGDGDDVPPVGGRSAGGAMALALAYLHGLTPDARAPYNRRTVLTANVTRDGTLLGVTEIDRKMLAVAERELTLLVSPANGAKARAEAQERGPDLRAEVVEDVPASLAVMRIHQSRHPYWMAPLLVVILLGGVAAYAVGRAHGERDARRLRELAAIVARDAHADPGRAAIAALAAQRLGAGKGDARDALLRVAAVDPRLRGVASSGRPATAVAVSPDGRRIAVGGPGQRVRVQEPGGGRYRAAAGGGAGISALAFTPDGKALISGDEEGLLIRWDISGPVPRPVQEGFSRGRVDRLAVSPGGRLLALQQAGRRISVWPLAVPRRPLGSGPLLTVAIARLPVTDPTDMVFVDEDSVAVTSARKGEVEAGVYAASTGSRERTLLPANRTVFRGAYSLAMARLADGRRVLAAGRHVASTPDDPELGRVVVWETRHWKVVRQVEDRRSVIRLAAGRDGDRLVVGSSGAGRGDAPTTLKVLDLNTGEWRGPELGGPGMMFRAEPQFDSAGGRLAALTDGWHATDWSMPSGPALHRGVLTRVVTDPRSPGRVITVGMDGMVRVVDVPSLRVAQTIDLAEHGPIISMAVAPGGRTIVTGHIDGRAVVSDLARGEAVRVLGEPTPHGLGRILSVAFDERAGRVAIGDLRGTVEVWDPRDGRLLEEIPSADSEAVRALLFLARGDELVIGYDRDHASVVPLRGGTARRVDFPDGLAVAVPLSASTLLTGENNGELHVTGPGLRPAGAQPSARLATTVMNIAVSPDRRSWLVPDLSGAVHVIAANGGREIAAVNAMPADGAGTASVVPFYTAAFTGDGRYGVFGSASGRLAVLGLTGTALLSRVCALLPAGAAADPDISVPAEAHMGRREVLDACR